MIRSVKETPTPVLHFVRDEKTIRHRDTAAVGQGYHGLNLTDHSGSEQRAQDYTVAPRLGALQTGGAKRPKYKTNRERRSCVPNYGKFSSTEAPVQDTSGAPFEEEYALEYSVRRALYLRQLHVPDHNPLSREQASPWQTAAELFF